jgi:hypothetical protein
MQQGFLKGRSIISNLIDLDTDSMTISLATDRGAAVLFDFKAAFPSISQEYIHRVLERLGMPEPCRQLIQSLYNDNKCVISCLGSMLPGFRLTAGVRQGCPLSPLLFAVAADILLRSLADSCPTATIRAFADDTATASADFWNDAPKMQQLFEQFERISGLGLHFGKSVIIPLSPEPLQSFHARLRLVVPKWADMQVATKGTYLGFAVGPGKKDTTWEKPAAKFMARVKEWSNLKTGLQYDTLLYNTFSMSVLSYVSQLEHPPNWLLDRERQALRIAASGPGNWAVPDDLWRLKESFGLFKSFKSLRVMARSAQLRVYACDATRLKNGGFQRRAAALRDRIFETDQMDTKKTWADWYDRSFLLRIDDNRKEFERGLGTIAQLQRSISAKELLAQKTFQRKAYQLILQQGEPNAEFRVREKMERWVLGDPLRHMSMQLTVKNLTPAWTSRKTLHNLHLLNQLVTPRVVAACFSTLWNRWTTARRYQRRSHYSNVCQLGCGGGAEDSIEHYARCSQVRLVGGRQFRLRPDDQVSLHTFVLCNPHIETQQQLIAAALLVYATYRATNLFRHSSIPTPEVAYDALVQFAREGARGHQLSARTFDEMWSKCATSTPLPPIPAKLSRECCRISTCRRLGNAARATERDAENDRERSPRRRINERIVRPATTSMRGTFTSGGRLRPWGQVTASSNSIAPAVPGNPNSQ